MKIYFAAFFTLLSITLSTTAAGPAVWTVSSKSDVLRGDARGVSIDDNGTISLAPKLTEIYKTEQSYIWSSTVDAAGNVYVGTGGDGKVFRIDAAGRGALFADLAELNVTALALGRAGEVYAGTSPDGKVYRIDQSGAASVYFAPAEKYIWSLAVVSDGSLAVATGDQGRIYKVRAVNATPTASLLFDTSETHVISLAADARGNLYAGTDSNGLVMRFGSDGKPFGLLDSPLREIHDIALAADGSLYVLALGESASAPKPVDASAAAPAATPASLIVSVEKPVATAETPAKSRYDLTSAKTAVYRLLPDGGNDLLWASPTVSGFSLLANSPGGVIVGTSDKGRLFSIGNDGREKLLVQTDANQVSTIRAGLSAMIATSSNPGSVYRLGSEPAAEGTYESAVLDAKASASWGRVWWGSTGSVTLQTRSGNTEKTDETWSPWSTTLTEQKGAQVASPTARYLQWRAVFKGPSPASLSEVSIAFAARNIAPEVLSIQVLPTSVGLVANPPIQIDPNIELSGLDPVTFGIASTVVAPRRVYQRGATSLQWNAEDRNGDRLVYDVFYRHSGEAGFKPLRGGLTETFIAIDGQSLADGRYVFKIVARDTPSNPGSLALEGERITEPISIDNTAPTVAAVSNPVTSASGARVSFSATDIGSYIIRAEYSINGGEWVPVYADDGISDSPTERYTINTDITGGGEYAVTLRVWDVNGNAGNARTIVRR
ncbi:MAG: PQQ-binding-like beta-propeller repeat protein [Pyrinomonadaceae bacterium]